MCPGESAGRSAGQGGPDELAAAIMARIAGGDLPAGAELDPVRLAFLFDTSDTAVLEALHLLEGHGVTEQDMHVWRVSRSRGGQGRDLLHWLVPLLRSVVSLAAARVTPAEAAGILAAYDRYAGLSGEGTAAARIAGYRQMMERLAAVAGSRFHQSSMAGLFDRAEPMLARMITRQMAIRAPAEPDDALGRLAQALMQGKPDDASAALEDHLILLARYLDCPEPTGP